MKDAPTDRDGEGDALAGPKNPWVSWLVWAILALGLYVLSSGPVQWLVLKEYCPAEVAYIYLPLQFLPDSAAEAVKHYIGWWRP